MAGFFRSNRWCLALVLLGPACAVETKESGGAGETSGSDDTSDTDEFEFGDPLYRLWPFFCDDCRRQELRRLDGDVIALWATDIPSESDPLAQIVDQAFGDLTPAGLSMIAQLSEELYQAIVAEQVEIDTDCLEANPWVFIFLLEQDVDVPYGVGCPPPEAVALDEFYRTLILDLAECQANEWVTPHSDCVPVALTES